MNIHTQVCLALADLDCSAAQVRDALARKDLVIAPAVPDITGAGFTDDHFPFLEIDGRKMLIDVDAMKTLGRLVREWEADG